MFIHCNFPFHSGGTNSSRRLSRKWTFEANWFKTRSMLAWRCDRNSGTKDSTRSTWKISDEGYFMLCDVLYLLLGTDHYRRYQNKCKTQRLKTTSPISEPMEASYTCSKSCTLHNTLHVSGSLSNKVTPCFLSVASYQCCDWCLNQGLHGSHDYGRVRFVWFPSKNQNMSYVHKIIRCQQSNTWN